MVLERLLIIEACAAPKTTILWESMSPVQMLPVFKSASDIRPVRRDVLKPMDRWPAGPGAAPLAAVLLWVVLKVWACEKLLFNLQLPPLRIHSDLATFSATFLLFNTSLPLIAKVFPLQLRQNVAAIMTGWPIRRS